MNALRGADAPVPNASESPSTTIRTGRPGVACARGAGGGRRAQPASAASTSSAVLRRIVCHDAAVGQPDHTPGAPPYRLAVRDDEQRLPARVERHQQLEHVLRGTRVELAGRLVGEQQRRLVDERARDRDALLLAARERGRAVVHTIAQTDVAPRPLGACGRVVPVSRVARGERHVLARVHVRQQVEALEHEADRAGTDRRELRARRARERAAVDDHVTRRGTVQPAEHVHERGLPAAALADDRDVVAGLHAQRHAVERPTITVTTASPRAMPAMPPSAPIVAASPTNVSRMEPSVAPIALRIPISRVRSVTAIVIVLITENAPTSSAMSAAPNTIASKIPSVERTVLATSRGSRADKPSISAMRRASNPVSVPFFDATMNADTGSGGSDCRNAGTTWRSRSCASANGTTTAASKMVNVLSSTPTTTNELPCSAITSPTSACSAAAKSGPITATRCSPRAADRPRVTTSKSRSNARA